MIGKLFGESFAMLMIGDGVLCVLNPSRHSRRWKEGPQAWQNAMETLAQNPNATRVFGVLEIALGVWLANAAEPEA